MKRSLAIDIESYSSVDLQNAGVYAYVDAPDFEILLIAYKFDEADEITVIDLTSYPDRVIGIDLDFDYPEFWRALTDPDVIKTAYNANFERTALSKFFDEPMPPEQWKCTAVHAATLGLPRSLGDVGEALGLPQDKQKYKTGKALINYFCKPCKATKINGGRTRNLPGLDRDKWNLFIEYNRQDVVAEQEILNRLRPYPITEKEQELWCFDQRMNDRGVMIDLDFVEGIIIYDAQYKSQLTCEAKEITGLSNPNSPAQLKKMVD